MHPLYSDFLAQDRIHRLRQEAEEWRRRPRSDTGPTAARRWLGTALHRWGVRLLGGEPVARHSPRPA